MRDNAAWLWRRILTSNPEDIFGSEASRLLNRNPQDRVPQPGFVGPRYQRGGLVFISANPGGGPEQGLSADDKKQYGALKRLRKAEDSSVRAQFDELTNVLAEIMPHWKIHHNFIAPVLDWAKVEFSKVAYINLLKWRTTSSKGLNRLYELSWNDHTREQLELLAPGRVIAVGVDPGRAFEKHFGKPADFVIPRAIGNNVGQPGRAVLARIEKLGRALLP